MKYASLHNTKKTPQSRPIPGEKQVQNRAGGYVYEVDNSTLLNRFLILGTDEPTYYASAQDITDVAIAGLTDLIARDPIAVVANIIEVSQAGRAPRNDHAIFALALVSANANAAGRRAAFDALPKVCRTATHLYAFLEARQALAGWGRGMRRAVANWYNQKDVNWLAYQAVKYRQRNGWTHRDALRLAHPIAESPERAEVFKFILGKEFEFNGVPNVIRAFIMAQNGDKSDVLYALENSDLPWEGIPTEYLKDREVWETLLEKLPATALIRNLRNMTNANVFDNPFGDNVKIAVDKLTDSDWLRRSRIHPINVLNALKAYSETNNAVGSITNALNEAFYASFNYLEPIYGRTFVALDVSGSMFGNWGWPDFGNRTQLTPAEIAGAMAMTHLHQSEEVAIWGFASEMRNLGLHKGMSLEEVLQVMKSNTFGATDCSQPMLMANKKNWPVDNFVIYTDNETWYGRIHPSQALKNYRNNSGINSRLVVCATDGVDTSIADPEDAGMLDVSGFDSAVPNLVANFFNREF